jgi:hypothetical protein
VQARRSDGDEELRKLLRRGWHHGAEDFIDRLEERIVWPLSENHDPSKSPRRSKLAGRLLAHGESEASSAPESLSRLPKAHPVKPKLAERLHQETPTTLRWIAGSLRMGSGHYVSHLPYLQSRKRKKV